MQVVKDPVYGHSYFGEQIGPEYHRAYHDVETIEWNDGRLAKFTRVRMLTDPGFPYWDFSYCYGELKDGTKVEVTLPFHQLGRRKWKSEAIEYAKRDGIYLKGLGFFNAIAGLC